MVRAKVRGSKVDERGSASGVGRVIGGIVWSCDLARRQCPGDIF